MLRVVLCIICLHPFLWVFLLALLYHTVKDFFVLILLNIDQFCIVLAFLDVLQDFNPRAVAGSQSSCACRLAFSGRPRPGAIIQSSCACRLAQLDSARQFCSFWTVYRFRGGAGRAEKRCGGESLLVSNYSCFLLFFCFILNISEISDFFWAGRKTQVHRRRGSSPPQLVEKGRLLTAFFSSYHPTCSKMYVG